MGTTVRLGPLKFSLQATIGHHGPSIQSGHYTASINCCKKHSIATITQLRSLELLTGKTPLLHMFYYMNWLTHDFWTRTGGWEFDRSHGASRNWPKPVGWMMCFLLMTFVPVLLYIYIYIYMLVTFGICFKQHFDTKYLVFYNPSPPRIFLSLDLLSEYRIQHGAIGPLYVTSSYSTWIFCRGVSGFATDCPCDVWCRRGLTTCLLHVGPPFGNRFLNTSWDVGLTYWIVYLHFFVFWQMQLYMSWHIISILALSLLLKYYLFFQVLLY